MLERDDALSPDTCGDNASEGFSLLSGQREKVLQWILRHGEGLSILVVIGVFAAPFFGNGIWAGHDWLAHILRLFNTVSALESGQLPPVINSALDNPYGYSWNLFYPPLTAYLAAAASFGLSLMGVTSEFTAMRATWAFLLITAAMSMFSCLKHMVRVRFAALAGTMLYVTAPYFVADVFTRSALGEAMSFVFLPLICKGLYSVCYEKGEHNYLLTIGIAGILLSNIPSSIILFFALTTFFIVQCPVLMNSRVRLQILYNALFTMLIVCFFYVPLLTELFRNEITIFVLNNDDGIKRFVSQSIPITWLVFPFQLDGVHLYYGFPLLFSAGILFFFVPQNWKTVLLMCFCLAISIVVSNVMPWSRISKLLHFFQFIQFPWRILYVGVFLTSLLAAYNIRAVANQRYQSAVLLGVSLTVSMAMLFQLTPLNRIMVTPSDGELIYKEYLPVKTFDYIDELQKTPATVSIIDGNTTIDDISKKRSIITFTVHNINDEATIELPLLAYLGYKATLQPHGKQLNLHQTSRGLWSVRLKPGQEGQVRVAYEGTMAARVSFWVSVVALVSFFAYWVMCKTGCAFEWKRPCRHRETKSG